MNRFLKSYEPFCVSACSQYLHKDEVDSCWILDGKDGIDAALIYSNNIVFPIFIERPSYSLKPFLKWFSNNKKIYALHGMRSNVMPVEEALCDLGIVVAEYVNYDLLELADSPCIRRQPAGLVLRKPVIQDMEELFHLHAGYQKEEVMTNGAVFNPAACRLIIEQIFKNEQVMVAEMNCKLVGKVNTNALSFSRAQIGGVYVLPQYRRYGIGSYMVANFAAQIRCAGMIPSLFVKDHNITAYSMYKRIGFSAIGYYRISYC